MKSIKIILINFIIICFNFGKSIKFNYKNKIAYLELNFELENILKSHLQDWWFLTEIENTIDIGISLSQILHPRNKTEKSYRVKRNHFKKVGYPIKNKNIFSNDVKTGQESKTKEIKRKNSVVPSVINMKQFYKYNTLAKSNFEYSKHFNKNSTNKNLDINTKLLKQREKRSKMPVIYMPGQKKKRKCAHVTGILAGFNTFNYLTFVNGVITLVLNINNNINNNNNNNNLNNNNDISNNNIDVNQNTNTASQVSFPSLF